MSPHKRVLRRLRSNKPHPPLQPHLHGERLGEATWEERQAFEGDVLLSDFTDAWDLSFEEVLKFDLGLEFRQQGSKKVLFLVPNTVLSNPLESPMEGFEQYLEGREREIFLERIISPEPKTLKDFGNRWGITRERVRQIESRVLATMALYFPPSSTWLRGRYFSIKGRGLALDFEKHRDKILTLYRRRASYNIVLEETGFSLKELKMAFPAEFAAQIPDRDQMQERFADYIRHMRRARGWSQSFLAEKVGLQVGHISGLENYRYAISYRKFLCFCEAFGVALEDAWKVVDPPKARPCVGEGHGKS